MTTLRVIPSLSTYVCIPYRGSHTRATYFDSCRTFWSSLGHKVITADSNPDLPFSLTEARNNCVDQIPEEDAVCIIVNADTIAEVEWVEEAVHFASKGKVVYPFTKYCYMRAESIDRSLASETPIYTKQDSVSGCLVISKKVYKSLGGMDTDFHRVWGYEDNAFYTVAETLSTVVRLPGNIYSFEHEVDPPGRLTGPDNPNFWRYEIYKACFGKREMMEEFIRPRVEKYSEESSARD